MFPAKKKLQEYRVLITTLITASRWEVCVLRKEVGGWERTVPGSGARGWPGWAFGLVVRCPDVTPGPLDASQAGLSSVSH